MKVAFSRSELLASETRLTMAQFELTCIRGGEETPTLLCKDSLSLLLKLGPGQPPSYEATLHKPRLRLHLDTFNRLLAYLLVDGSVFPEESREVPPLLCNVHLPSCSVILDDGQDKAFVMLAHILYTF